jgi:hypothetical protein
VHSVRTGARPRVSGDDALRALRVADRVIHSLNTHAWSSESDGPIGPRDLPEPAADTIVSAIPAPKHLRYAKTRKTPSSPSNP